MNYGQKENNEDDKYYVLGYSSLTKDNFNEKYN